MLLMGVQQQSSQFSGTQLNGAEIGNFNESAGRYVRSTSGLLDFRPGKTLNLEVDFASAAGTNNELLIGCFTGAYTAGKGWVIERGASSNIIYLTLWNGAGYTALATNVRLGVRQLAIRWSGATGHVYVSIDGSAETNLGALATPNTDATCVTAIGSPVSTGNIYADSLKTGAICAFGLIDSELSASDLAASSNSMNGSTPLNRFVLPSQFSSPVVDFNAYRDWNGSASTFVTSGSSPITFAVTGAISKTDTSEVYYATSANMYHDNGLDVSETYAVRHNAFSRIRFTTSLRRLAIHQTSTIFSSYTGSFASIGIFNGGAYSSLSTSTVANASQVVDTLLPAGSSKTIDLTEGTQAYVAGNVLGTFMSGIRVPTDAVITAPTIPTDRVLVVGDSIINGYITSNAQSDNPIAVLRGLTDYQVTCLGWGSATSYEFTQSANRAAWVTSMAAMLNGTNSNTLIWELQTNDYGLNAQSAANYETNLGAYIDDLKVAVPNLQVKLLGAISRISPAAETANGSGSTLDNYRSADFNLTSGRTYVRYINLKYVISDANHDADGIHLTTIGSAVLSNTMYGTLDFALGDISNLGLDLDSQLGITLNGSDVSQWDDQSGNGNNVSQGTAARQPLYNSTGAPNSLPSIDFTRANNDLLTCTTSLLASLTGWSFFIVEKRPSTVTNTISFAGDLGNCVDQVGTNINYTYSAAAAYGQVATTDTNWLARSIVYNGGGATNADKHKTYDNIAQKTLTFGGLVPSANSAASFFVLGSYYSDNHAYSFDGKIAKIVIYTKTLSANEKARVDAYLANKYSVNA